jgi:ABC-2 type transport system permease protein
LEIEILEYYGMMRRWISLKSLTVASVKMYFRNVTAVFFTLFIPILLIGIFGLLNTGNSGGELNIGLHSHAQSPLAKQFVSQLKAIKAFRITEAEQSVLGDKLAKGKIDLEVLLPDDFGAITVEGTVKPSTVFTRYNEARPQTGQTAGLILSQLASGLNAGIAKAPQIIKVNTLGVKANDLTYIDFLVPGIIAMSIMQLGILSVAFGFISFKTSGALRRLQVTPTHPVNFLIGQSVARLIIGVIQVLILLSLGVFAFNLHLIGSIFDLLVVSTLGVIVFLAFGFAIAGWAKDENQAAPVANLVSFPMLFLSGVFFPRDGFPSYLKTITDFFPLTYLADAMHKIANEGASLWAVRGDLLGLIIWGVIGYIIAIRLFKWE